MVNAKPTVRVSSWAALHCALCSDKWTRRIHWIFYYCNLRLNKLNWQMPCFTFFNEAVGVVDISNNEKWKFLVWKEFPAIVGSNELTIARKSIATISFWLYELVCDAPITHRQSHIFTSEQNVTISPEILRWHIGAKWMGEQKKENLHQHIASCATSGDNVDNDNNDFNSIQLSNWNWVQRNRARAIRIHHRCLSVQRP